MERKIDGGSDPEALDSEDDTGDSEADFDFAAPSPTNNAGTQPETTEHPRTVTLALRRELVARGKVTAEGDFPACIDGVAVKIQRRSDGRWRTIKQATTGTEGAYRVRLRARPGRYRTVAPASSPSDEHRCLRAISPTRRNG
jgi:hypothetical protein